MNRFLLNRILFSVSILLGILLLVVACTTGSEEVGETLFESVPSSLSNINFSNDLTVTKEHNIYTDGNFYAGAGVGLGDISGNGLPDIYLVSNQESNSLYLNKGDFKFEDITDQAGVGGTKPWSTGVSFVDINGNGLLDIYVTNSSAERGDDRKNELFINNGDLTFTERAAEFGIADSGYSIHAAFFDYDNDGDLDMYLVNNYAAANVSRGALRVSDRERRNFEGGDRFYRNDGGVFTDITEEAGIYSSEVNFSLGASVGDLTRNGFMDIYVSNDFFERDYLYLNNGDGTFREVLEEKLSSISTTSMGGDIADLDNDGYPEIFVTDMLPSKEERIKTITDFIGWEQYLEEVELGYHRKFTRNTLQYNRGDGKFSEIGRYAGVEASDWSWGALIADFNLNGLRDIYVPNGFYRDVTNKDHLIELARGDLINEVVRDGQLDYVKLESLLPSTPTSNYLFENHGDLRFVSRATEWGLGHPGFSHGAAYGDLNGNGALDMVVNNVNMEVFLYRNWAPELFPERSWLQLNLQGETPNTVGVGAQVELVSGEHYWYVEQMPQRSFQSSMDPVLHVGLGEAVEVIDTLEVHWPDGRVSVLTDVNARQRVEIRQADAEEIGSAMQHSFPDEPLLSEVSDPIGLDWRHNESDFNDFSWFSLLFHMRSTEGPPVCSGDASGNGREEVYIGGAHGQAGVLFMESDEGRYVMTVQPALEEDRDSEDTDCLFFDSNGDGRLELVVASGSSEFTGGNRALADRLYRIGEAGELIRDEQALPRPSGGHVPTGVIRAADVDGDGYADLFIGPRLTPFGFGSASGYGVPVGGYLLRNDGSGRFEEVTDEWAPGLLAEELGTPGITAAVWGDLNGNGWKDLVVAGEWMPLTIFYNRQGRLERADLQETGLDTTHGWWHSLALADLNGNGRLDLVGGNHGLNSRFKASVEEPVEFWVDDFNRNGKLEHLFGIYNDGGPYPAAQLNDLLHELPHLRLNIPGFADYAEMTIAEIFPLEQLDEAVHYKAELLSSVIAWNNGDGSFDIEQLPFQAQLAPVYSILPYDLDGNGTPELLMGGNLDAVRPQAGPYDATFGIVLRQDSSGRYQWLDSQTSGFFIEGEIRSIHPVEHDGGTLFLVGLNNRDLQLFRPFRE